MGLIRYCWLSPELGFSGSWTEKEHNSLEEGLTQKEIEVGLKNGWRLIKYEIQGNDFKFEPNMIITTKPKEVKN